MLSFVTKIVLKSHESQVKSFYICTGKKSGDLGEWATQYLLKEKLY